MRKSTREKLCDAAIEIFSEEGYKAASTKKISERAGVSEMTLFRHFGTKADLFKDAYNKALYQPSFEKVFREVTGDLNKDLLKIAYAYLDVLNTNRSLILMELRSRCLDKYTGPPLTEMPKRLKLEIMDYLKREEEHGLFFKADTEMLAVSFISLVIGSYFMDVISGDIVTDITPRESIKFSVDLFVKGVLEEETR